MMKGINQLEEGSIYEWLATDYLERGCSATLTAFMINIRLSNDGKDMRISEHCIRRLIHRLGAVVKGIASQEGHRKYVESMEGYASKMLWMK